MQSRYRLPDNSIHTGTGADSAVFSEEDSPQTHNPTKLKVRRFFAEMFNVRLCFQNIEYFSTRKNFAVSCFRFVKGRVRFYSDLIQIVLRTYQTVILNFTIW